MKLTAEQNKIIHLSSGVHLVLAPPGTGKTEILSQRINYALDNGVLPTDMLCLTFTNRAAKSMNQRVAEKYGNTGVFIGNVHTFCLNFLKKNHVLNNASLLLDEDEADNLFRESLGVISNDFENYFWKYRNIQNYIFFSGKQYALKTKPDEKFFLQQKNLFSEALSNSGIYYNLRKFLVYYYNRYVYGFTEESLKVPSYEEPLPLGKKENESSYTKEDFRLGIQTIFSVYDNLKKEINGVDFDDLLGLTYQYIKENPDSITKFKWLQVDEVQDLNPIQWDIIKNITDNNSHIVYFGDYEQAIYSFLDAKLDILHEIEKTAKVHNFTKNFRSPDYLLRYYVKFCKTFLEPKWKKDPIPETIVEKDKISLCFRHIIGTSDHEQSYIASRIIPNLPKDESKAILLRTNKQADEYGRVLDQCNLQYFKISGYDIMKYAIVKSSLAVLMVLADKNDRASWIRIFYNFSNFEVLREARNFIISSFALGIQPIDFIYEDYFVLEDFRNLLENDRIVVFDTETTGLDTQKDDIIQIAAVEIVNGKIGKIFNRYILTDKSLAETVDIHKIEEDFLKENGVAREEAFKEFIDFVGDTTLVAHNLRYDYEIINNNFAKCSLKLSSKIKYYDSIDLTKRFFPDFPAYKLAYLLDKLKIEGINSHNAVDDVKATANLLFKLFEDTDDYFFQRKEFLKNNRNTIKSFRNKFMSFYKEMNLMLNNETTLSEAFKKVAIFYANSLNIEIPPDIFKVTTFMDFISKKGNLSKLLENHIFDFATYKESDLVTGKEKIIISTIHKAKGLEFENVIIPGCYKDNLPHFLALQSTLQEDYDEESRLFYVAMSRSQKRLIFSAPHYNSRRYHYEEGEIIYEQNMISLYIQQMADMLDWKTIDFSTSKS